jgi:hypothetical protein
MPIGCSDSWGLQVPKILCQNGLFEVMSRKEVLAIFIVTMCFSFFVFATAIWHVNLREKIIVKALAEQGITLIVK